MADTASTVEQLLREGAVALRASDIPNPRLDARVLLAALLGREASTLLPFDETPVDPEQAHRFRNWIMRRIAHEPVSRIIGVREFRGLSFQVSPAVLDPRADSEVVVDLALSHLTDRARILDLGTGSGCLLLSLLHARADATGLGTDQSEAALQMAQRNAEALGLADRVVFARHNWLDGIQARFDLIISNPPYIPAATIPELMPDVRDFDPRSALDGGEDGLDPYRVILSHAAHCLTPHGTIVFEIGAGQREQVVQIASEHGFSLLETVSDLGGHIRGLSFKVSS